MDKIIDNTQKYKLWEINLIHIPLNLPDIKLLCNTLNDYTFLKTLCLNNTKMTDIKVKYISKALIMNIHIEKLHLSNNQIGDIGAKHISKLLKANKNIKTLMLFSNDIGDGIKYIRDALKTNNTLQHLSVSYNRINNDTIKYIGDIIETTMLYSLGYSNMIITEDDIKYVEKILVNNISITDISYRFSYYKTREICERNDYNGYQRGVTLMELSY